MRLVGVLGAAAAAALAAFPLVSALGEQRVIHFPTDSENDDASVLAGLAETAQTVFAPSTVKSKTSDFIIASKHDEYAVPFLLDSADNTAIHLAAQTLARDVHSITGYRPILYNDTLPSNVSHAVIIGSVDSKLIESTKEDRDEIKGKWESYDARVLEKPIKGLKSGLVITGSDRRGTVYALYTLSEQMGVSPFHYWADVPIRSHSAIAFNSSLTLSHGEPTVKYRGLFINDEHPAMWTWAVNKWKTPKGEGALTTDMYEPWFEMMLRLKANYFWPAMYASMFDVDGAEWARDNTFPAIPGPNQDLADNMGIVMGSSHHEPMARNKPEWDRAKEGEWDWKTNADFLKQFWHTGAERAKGKETLFTMGMRGDGDMPLTGASNELVENITATQQSILRDVYGDDLSDVPQMWAMYKEVAEYYNKGLKVPDDITILFTDDNYGNLVTVQPPDKAHPAGAGMYYHVDYVGRPRAYKWINTINLAKTWDQMSVARAFNTTAIWILNVGTLKPLELPVEHFMSLAWDLDAWPVNSVDRFLEDWAAREFGQHVATETADIMKKYSMYASRRKAELVSPDTYSLNHFEEAERVLGEWQGITDRAAKVHEQLDKDTKPAFFELVYMLCLMQTNLNELYISSARSTLYAQQARTAANVYAKRTFDAFENDWNLTEQFHSMLDRKWDHMLTQSHINWNGILEPEKDSLPPISWVNPNVPAYQGIPVTELEYGRVSYIRMTMEDSKGSWPGNTRYNCDRMEHCGDPTLLPMDKFGRVRWIDIGSAGPKDVHFNVTSPAWVRVKPDHGLIKRDASTDTRLRISIDWDKVPSDIKQGTLHISASDGSEQDFIVPVNHYYPPEGYSGFVEGDGYVAIEAGSFSRHHESGDYAFVEMDNYGRTRSGLEMMPITTKNFTAGEGPSLSYDFYVHESGKANITLDLGPSLNFLGNNHTLAFAFQLDDNKPATITPVPILRFDEAFHIPTSVGAVPYDWYDIAEDEIRKVVIPVELENKGEHSITLYGMSTGVIFERIVIDMGGLKQRAGSYLGPPESVRL